MTQHLIDQGHRRIAFTCAKPQLTLTQERLGGYRDALAGAGLPVDQSLVRLDTSFTEAAGHQAARSLLLLPGRPTAIFTASDTMAIGAYRAAAELGLAIPEQVAIAGFDGIGPSALLHPPLTTVLTSYQEFGRRSTDLLLDLIDGRLPPPQRVVIPHRLLIRESTASPPPHVQTASRGGERPARPGSVAANGRVQVLGDAGQAGIVAQLLQAEGWDTIPPGSALGGAAAGVLVLDLRQDLNQALERASTDGEAMARAMAAQPGALLLIGVGPAATTAVGAGARAGMEQVARSLSARWRGRDLRVNALLAVTAGAPLAGPCRFLLSDTAAGISGQLLVVSDGSPPG
jgi:Periplasmic binding protein-like domain